MTDPNAPRAYDITDSDDIKRLLRECRGYIRVYAGTDTEGRRHAIEALDKLARPNIDIDVWEHDAGTV